MAFSEKELEMIHKEVGAFCDNRVPDHIKDKVYMDYEIDGQSIFIFEVRPHFRDPDRKIKSPIAKVSFVRTQQRWHLYWMRADLKYHKYDSFSGSNYLNRIIYVIDKDEHGCFFG